MRTRSIWMVSAMSLLMMGCGGPDEPSASGGGVDQSTPQAAAEGYSAAVAAGHWEAAFRFLSRGAQSGFVVEAVSTGTFGVETRDQVDEFLAFVQQFDLPDDPTALSARDDLGQVFADIVGWIEDHAPEGRAAEALEMRRSILANAAFEDFQAVGDHARAEMVSGEISKRIELRRMDGRWYWEQYF